MVYLKIYVVPYSHYNWIWRYSEFLNVEKLFSFLHARIVGWVVTRNFFACGVEIEVDE